MTKSIYENLEDSIKVIYPTNGNATYKSMLNYSEEATTERQRWYRYKEGYSVNLVESIIREFCENKEGTILDPFLGSGTTILGANNLDYEGIGFEVNPFSCFLSKCKLTNYTLDEKVEFTNLYPQFLREAKILNNKMVQPLPKLSIAEKVFNPEIQNYFLTVKYIIKKYKGAENVKNLLYLGWLSSIEPVSNYRKAGNGLKKKAISKMNVVSIGDVDEVLLDLYKKIEEDLDKNLGNFRCSIFNQSSIKLKEVISPNSIQGVIFSPPYANSFDYTEIYKLELWFGDFVKDYSDLKILRKDSLRSHLNGLINSSFEELDQLKSLPELDILVNELQNKKLWNNKIPVMLKKYFSEMFDLIEKIYDLLVKDGFCTIIVGNSSYGGIVIPTDLLLANYAIKMGFEVENIVVDRFIITSSQQYKITLSNKQFLRESIVCLRKR